jgi:putative addiction module CopG family antidote
MEGLVVRTTTQLSVTLPHAMATSVRQKVADGLYASESEVVRDGLRLLLARDEVVEEWLRRDVADAYDKLVADPSGALTPDQVRQRVAVGGKDVL